jgi:hypothetical protein
MTLPYFVRLIVLCGASFFLIHTALAFLVCLTAPAAMRLAGRMRASTAAHFLLAVRVMPVALTLLILFGLCVPSYLWLEPGEAREQIGLACMLIAVLGALAWATSLSRLTSAVAGTMRYMRHCKLDGHETTLAGEPSPVLVLEEEAPVLAMAGVVHQQMVVSRSVMLGLTGEQIEAAFRHEQAHRLSRDNFKRLLILFCPDVFPLAHGFSALERNWCKFTEWAADDHAAEGDSRRALTLASALVAVAKMTARPRLPLLFTSLLADDNDLSERVDRLLHPEQTPKGRKLTKPILSGAAACAVVVGALVLVLPSSLSLVHEVLEHLVR